MREIAITGVGFISNRCLGFKNYRDSLFGNKEVKVNENFEKELENMLYDSKINVRRNDLMSKMILASVSEIFSSNDYSEILPEKKGMILNTEMGTIHSVYKYLAPVIEKSISYASPALFPNTVINAPLGRVARQFELKGSSFMFCGTNPIVYAVSLLENIIDDMVIVGCVDEGIELYEMITGKKTDKNSEVAVSLALENANSIKNMSIDAFGYILGVSSITNISASLREDVPCDNIYLSMTNALYDAEVDKNDIQCVVTLHLGGSTRIEEEMALKLLFGKNNKVPVVSHFSKYGFCYSADELMNIIDGILYLKENGIDGPALVNTINHSSINSFVVRGG